MGNVIFDDLNIDYSSMLKDPESFKKQVYEAAEELKSVLKSSTSIDNYIKSLPKEDVDLKPFETIMNDLWAKADNELPITAYSTLAEKLRKLASEVEYIARSKATQELANQTGALDKQMASNQYSRLREAFNEYAKAAKVLGIDTEVQPLPAMPGNYGAPVGLVHYVFMFPNEDEGYLNYNAVCRRIGIETRNLMDTVEYVETHSELGITIKKLTN